MQSPIPIEPMHSFPHDHHDQCGHMAHGHIRMYVAQHGSQTGEPMHAAYTSFDIRDPFHIHLTAVKTRHLLTNITSLSSLKVDC